MSTAHGITLGKTEVTLNARGRVSTDPPLVYTAPGGLVPLRIATWDIDEYRMMGGWPAPVPVCDIRQETLVSGTGEKITDRPAPIQIRTDATFRFLADEAYFSVTDLAWYNMNGLDLVWRSSVEYMPVLIDDYEDRVGAERFTRNAINFDSDTRNHMWLNMTAVLTPSVYTIIMVMSPNSTYGNDVTVPYNGIWCYGGPTPVGDTFTEEPDAYANVELQGNYIYLETDQSPRSKGPALNNHLNSNAPMYLVMTLGRPNSYIYVGGGPSSLTRTAIPSGSNPTPMNTNIVLGRSTGDVLHTADMALFEVGIYGGALSDSQVANEVSKLSQSYGGDT